MMHANAFRGIMNGDRLYMEETCCVCFDACGLLALSSAKPSLSKSIDID